MPNDLPCLCKYQIYSIHLPQMWVDCDTCQDSSEGETMKCSGCNKILLGKAKYFTLLCHSSIAIIPFVYCNPMCLALEWNCLEGEEWVSSVLDGLALTAETIMHTNPMQFFALRLYVLLKKVKKNEKSYKSHSKDFHHDSLQGIWQTWITSELRSESFKIHFDCHRR